MKDYSKEIIGLEAGIYRLKEKIEGHEKPLQRLYEMQRRFKLALNYVGRYSNNPAGLKEPVWLIKGTDDEGMVVYCEEEFHFTPYFQHARVFEEGIGECADTLDALKVDFEIYPYLATRDQTGKLFHLPI